MIPHKRSRELNRGSGTANAETSFLRSSENTFLPASAAAATPAIDKPTSLFFCTNGLCTALPVIAVFPFEYKFPLKYLKYW